MSLRPPASVRTRAGQREGVDLATTQADIPAHRTKSVNHEGPRSDTCV